MLNTKICLTVLVVYEILAVIVVHMTRVCNAMFGMNFCADGGFKYFIACFAIPALAFLVWMWIHEIIVGVERQHSVMHKARVALTDMVDDVKDKFAGKISAGDIEKFLAAAAIVGIRRYAQTHPHTKRMFDNIVATAQGRKTRDYGDEDDYDVYDDDDDADDGTDEDYTKRGDARGRGAVRSSASRAANTRSRPRK